MANTLDPMDLKQIITLHLDGYSNRRIGISLSISRNTVNTYMLLFKGSGYTFKELLSFDNARLEALFSSHTTIDNERYDALMLYFEGLAPFTLIPISFILGLIVSWIFTVSNKRKKLPTD